MKLLDPSWCAAGACARAHGSTSVLHEAQIIGRKGGTAERISAAATRVSAQLSRERSRLPQIFEDLATWRAAAQQAEFAAEHMPINPAGVLSESESNAIQALIQTYDTDAGIYNIVAAEMSCSSKLCSQTHEATARLAALHASLTAHGMNHPILSVAERLQTARSAEWERLRGALDDLEEWDRSASLVLRCSAHMPLTRTYALTEGERTAAATIRETVAEHSVEVRQLLDPASCESGHCGGLHRAGSLLNEAYLDLVTSGGGQAVVAAGARIQEQMEDERARLRTALDDLEEWGIAASLALIEAEHLPLTRTGALSEIERTAAARVQNLRESHSPEARHLLDPSSCDADGCQGAHESASLLGQGHADLLASGEGQAVVAACDRVGNLLKEEREEVAVLYQDVLGWPELVQQIHATREDALANSKATVQQLIEDSASIKISRTAMRLLPLHESSEVLVASLTVLRDAALTEKDSEFLTETAALASRVAAVVGDGFNSDWECEAGGKCERAHQVILEAFEAANFVKAQLARLTVNLQDVPTEPNQLLDPSLGLKAYLPANHTIAEIFPFELLKGAWAKLPLITNAENAAKEAATEARAAADKVRAGDVAEALKAMDLEVLRKAAPQRQLRTAPLEDYELHNVWDVLRFQDGYSLKSLPGLGEATARPIAQASLRLFEAVREETPVRIDVKRKGKATTALLESLARWDNARKFSPTKDEVALAKGLTRLIKKKSSFTPLGVLVIIEGKVHKSPPAASDILHDALNRLVPPSGTASIWTDFLSRPADYFGMLTELGFMTEDEKSMHGDLPEEIVEAVRAKELKRDYLTASLRAYQSFGARFALVQEKVIIGDEMGLGKTVEALAVLAHLRARGQSHFLVVCPAAVVSNWTRETAKHTKLKASRLHGTLWERNHAAKAWAKNGGVAVTTYDLLPWAKEYLSGVDLGGVILDEAHYIKNPRAKRSLAAAEIINSTTYAILMTGTPLENSVAEFRNLISYIRPDLAEEAPEYLAKAFRKHVAPAYLRRNQEDVLTELPEVVEIDEWMGMSHSDELTYGQAVREGQFMLMRRAAMMSEQSMKVSRLLEIAGEAEANGRRIIVFSYFREVLNQVARLLPGQVFGPLTGSLAAADRQKLVDRFSQAGNGAVLVAQITAGGVGLNIQSASVVVICEPQIKPTMESQAIARAHRMGQTDTVQVHRLLTEDSVDERIRDILKDKRQLFDEFARDSFIAKQAPDAVDVSEVELARRVVAAERERLSIVAG
ncbi:DEAD/DEAH box helicase [Arthrobacter humicola]|uniref:DEAD/DEAH box helicase n=1 Tax=Arthrobacter humicola TaxID=409291 RepID=UPI001FAD1F04|nr:DEAD/DEAH box helicase [Arthrobacter humicola]MCI9870509.1 DEAD/DEAH box helicase [Arthrobacter humicola]